jgi:hypothetical protein
VAASATTATEIRPLTGNNQGGKNITFIFLLTMNGIDFLRRFGECFTRWVVGDIGAALDLTAIMAFSRVTFSDHSGLRGGLSPSCFPAGARFLLRLFSSQGDDRPMSFSTKASSIAFTPAHSPEVRPDECRGEQG